jgi:general L-amino acid transport system substrate-binding protein
MRRFPTLRVIALAALAVVSCGAQALAQSGGDDLAAIRARGELVCGVGGASPGFSVNDGGTWRGIDADYCRAIAAAVLGDAAKVRFVPVSAGARFEALVRGDVDVLARSTTWTLEREAGQGIAFAAINYFDGQGFLVRADSGIGSPRQFEAATICVGVATTSERNLADWGRALRLGFKTLALPYTEAVTAFVERRCEVFTSDSSALAALRTAQGGRADRYVLLPELISKEPLAIAVRKADWRLFDVVRWVHHALLTAEELDLSSAVVGQARQSGNPDIQRLFGTIGESGRLLGLEPGWAARMVAQVGNYREIYERSLGALGLPRGANLLWLHGGLHYAPPMR